MKREREREREREGGGERQQEQNERMKALTSNCLLGIRNTRTLKLSHRDSVHVEYLPDFQS